MDVGIARNRSLDMGLTSAEGKKLMCFKMRNNIVLGLVTFARSDICANDICAKWPVLPVMSHHRWLMTGRARRGKGTKLGEGERD